MKTVIAKLKSVSPYSQSRYYNVDKLDSKESADAYEKRTWRERLHYGDDGEIYIPPMQFKNCMTEAAKYLSISIPGKGKSTYTKNFTAGVMVNKPLYLGIKKDDVKSEVLFVPSNGQRGGGSRVEKTFPIIHSWEGDVEFLILDHTITEEVFKYVLEQAGNFIGLGRFRPRNNGFYGRFAVEKLTWIEG